MEFEEIPASPTAKLMQAPTYDLHILALIGFMTTIDVDAFKKGLEQTAARHPRFSSVLVAKGEKLREMSWRQTKVDVNNHVFKHNLSDDPIIAEQSADKIVEDFTSALSRTAMDTKKPLWEAHILNIKTSDANSTVVFKFHHSLGDGVSLISLLVASAKRIDDPESLPVVVSTTKKSQGDNNGDDKVCVWIVKRVFLFVCWIFMVLFYTLADCGSFGATLMFLKDTETVIKGATKVELSAGKRFVHRVVSLEDVKAIKNAMNVAVNDVLLGVSDAGLTRYLNTRYAEKTENGAGNDEKRSAVTTNLFLRSAVVFNLRPSSTIEDLAEMMEKDRVRDETWGNVVGIVLLPLSMSLQGDPLTYIRKAKAVMDRKKLSLGAKYSSLAMKLMIRLLGPEIAASVTSRVFKHTTLTFSSVMGPKDEISLYGHPVSYIAPSVYGFPQSLIIHYQSYANKLVISVGADEKLIPNPHQLCDDLAKSIESFKEAVIKGGLVKDIEMC